MLVQGHWNITNIAGDLSKVTTAAISLPPKMICRTASKPRRSQNNTRSCHGPAWTISQTTAHANIREPCFQSQDTKPRNLQEPYKSGVVHHIGGCTGRPTTCLHLLQPLFFKHPQIWLPLMVLILPCPAHYASGRWFLGDSTGSLRNPPRKGLCESRSFPCIVASPRFVPPLALLRAFAMPSSESRKAAGRKGRKHTHTNKPGSRVWPLFGQPLEC